ncbi:MAG: hypothetical protein AB8H79_03620 [Myxococcota bacterium]
MTGKRFWYSDPLVCLCLLAYAPVVAWMIEWVMLDIGKNDLFSFNAVFFVAHAGLLFYVKSLIARWLAADTRQPILQSQQTHLDGLTAQWATRSRVLQGRIISTLLPLIVYGVLIGGLVRGIAITPSANGLVLGIFFLLSLGLTLWWLWRPVWQGQWSGPAALKIEANSRFISVVDPRDRSQPIVRVPTESTKVTVSRTHGEPTLHIGDWSGPVPVALNDWIVDLQRMQHQALPVGAPVVPDELQDLLGQGRTRTKRQNSSRDSEG